MRDLLTAIGLVLAIEGTLYALLAGHLKDLMVRMAAVSPAALRVGGVVALALGVFVVWLARG